MNTPSHLILTAAAAELVPPRRIVRSAALWGAIAPDLPLILLSAGGYVYFHHVLGRPVGATMRHMYTDLFFHDPAWIALHNLLHAPLLLLGGLLGLWWSKPDREAFWKSWPVWFLLSCLLHTLIDIPTHHDDGPLLFFPLDWQTRFSSPVSYWDSKHFGTRFMAIEGALDILLLGFLAVRWLLRWLSPASHQTTTDGPDLLAEETTLAAEDAPDG